MRPNNDKRKYLITDETSVVYLKNVIDDPEISVGAHTYYHDTQRDPRDFAKNNILYHFPGFGDSITIGKYCSIAEGTRILCCACQHDPHSLAWYPFPIIPDHWDTVCVANDLTPGHYGQPIVIGNDVWLGFESVIMPGVKIGDGAAVGTRSVVTHDVEPYTIVAGCPARPIKKRFDDKTIEKLLELKWWDLPDEVVNVMLPSLCHGDLEGALKRKAIYEAAQKAMGK